MTEKVDVSVATREGAHKVARLVYQQAQLMIADGKRVRIRCDEAKDVRSLRQNAFYWAHVLHEISAQVIVLGERWVDEAWHNYFKREFLGYVFDVEQVAGKKRKRVVKHLRSTTDLSVKEMSAYLEQVIAWGVTEHCVRFDTMNWEKWEQYT